MSRESAVEACARGWAVFPCLPGQKRPAVKDRWEERATTDPSLVKRYWPSGANVGVACGPSGLVVIDPDTPKPEQEAPPEWQEPGVVHGLDALALLAERAGGDLGAALNTFSVATPRGGMHLYYAAPEGVAVRNSASKIAWCVDVRGRGGYVVGAGSRIAEGRYQVVSNLPVAPLPVWLLRACAPPKPLPAERRSGSSARVRGEGGQSKGEAYRYATLRNGVERLLGTREGGRNDRLNAEAHSAAKAGWSRAEIEPVFLAAALRIGLPEAEARRTLASAIGGAA